MRARREQNRTCRCLEVPGTLDRLARACECERAYALPLKRCKLLRMMIGGQINDDCATDCLSLVACEAEPPFPNVSCHNIVQAAGLFISTDLAGETDRYRYRTDTDKLVHFSANFAIFSRAAALATAWRRHLSNSIGENPLFLINIRNTVTCSIVIAERQ